MMSSEGLTMPGDKSMPTTSEKSRELTPDSSIALCTSQPRALGEWFDQASGRSSLRSE